MAVLTPVRLFNPVQPGAAYGTLWTATGKTVLKELVVANVTGVSHNITISLVPSGGGASAANNILGGVAVAANSTLTFDMTQVMENGDFLSALADAAAVLTVVGSGFTVA